MKNILFLLIILSTGITNFSFAKLPGIKGSIKNAQNTPVEFANVVLVMANDSAIVKAGLTETDGTYLF